MLVAGIAYLAGALTGRGALAAAAVGALTFAGGGVLPAFLLIAFFVTSSLLSRWGASRKARLGDRFEKSSRRDASQVVANGGVAALLSLVYGATGEPLALAAMAGALAAVTADTWGTEVGILARNLPIRLIDGRRVEPGTSGAVSLEGSLAALAGAALMALLSARGAAVVALGMPVFLGGIAGAAVDSLLGATVQAMFVCPTCGKETERHPVHTCGSPTQPSRGWTWLRNDAVNAIASLTGAGLAAGLWLLIDR